MASRKCPNCGNMAAFLTMSEPYLERCTACAGWTYTKPLQNIEALYTEDYFLGKEYANYQRSIAVHRLNFNRKIDLLQATLPNLSTRRWLEIGSATGVFYQTLHERKLTDPARYLGVEISDYAREQALKLHAHFLSPLVPDLLHTIERFSPDIIIAWDVWEHLPDPASFFSSLLGVSAKGASLALTTVDSGSLVPRIRGARWRQYHPPTHLNYPTRKSFQEFCQSHHQKILLHESFGYYRPIFEYAKVLPPLAAVLNQFFPKMAELPLYLNLFDTQIVFAATATGDLQ